MSKLTNKLKLIFQKLFVKQENKMLSEEFSKEEVEDDIYQEVKMIDFYEDKLLFSNYASVTEKTSFFFVSIDGEETYMQEDFYEQHDFDDLRMQAKLDYLDEEEKIICLWYQDYDFEDIKHITFYDKEMSLRDCW